MDKHRGLGYSLYQQQFEPDGTELLLLVLIHKTRITALEITRKRGRKDMESTLLS